MWPWRGTIWLGQSLADSAFCTWTSHFTLNETKHMQNDKNTLVLIFIFNLETTSSPDLFLQQQYHHLQPMDTTLRIQNATTTKNVIHKNHELNGHLQPISWSVLTTSTTSSHELNQNHKNQRTFSSVEGGWMSRSETEMRQFMSSSEFSSEKRPDGAKRAAMMATRRSNKDMIYFCWLK